MHFPNDRVACDAPQHPGNLACGKPLVPKRFELFDPFVCPAHGILPACGYKISLQMGGSAPAMARNHYTLSTAKDMALGRYEVKQPSQSGNYEKADLKLLIFTEQLYKARFAWRVTHRRVL